MFPKICGMDICFFYSDDNTGNVATGTVYSFSLVDIIPNYPEFDTKFSHASFFSFFGLADATGVSASGKLIATYDGKNERYVLGSINFSGTSLNILFDDADNTSGYLTPFEETNGDQFWRKILMEAPVFKVVFDSITGGNLIDFCLGWAARGVSI